MVAAHNSQTSINFTESEIDVDRIHVFLEIFVLNVSPLLDFVNTHGEILIAIVGVDDPKDFGSIVLYLRKILSDVQDVCTDIIGMADDLFRAKSLSNQLKDRWLHEISIASNLFDESYNAIAKLSPCLDQKPKPSPPDAMSTDAYMEALLNAVHDFVYQAEVRNEKGVKSQNKKKKNRLPNPEPWVALAAATGLDPYHFDANQQKELISRLQSEFPDPYALVELIIENPSDSRLNFGYLLNENQKSVGDILVLEQQVLNHKLEEKKLEAKLLQIQRRNNVWKGAVMSSLGVSVPVYSDSDSDWVSE
jgi:hypothetical protein